MMWEWLLASIDPSRPHEVGWALSWHARVMVLSWGVLVPAGIFSARYLKILPWQNWPEELDSKAWWRLHWMGQSIAFALSLVGLALILSTAEPGPESLLHTVLGYAVMGFGTIQILMGVFRGTKGGPTAPQPDGSLSGDHFDMTRFRLIFEHVHLSLGYLALLLGGATILSGLWTSNAPRWMWVVLVAYWVFLAFLAAGMQLAGRAFDTYQAIWGPDPNLPGNQMKKMGWGTVRPGDRVTSSSKGTE